MKICNDILGVLYYDADPNDDDVTPLACKLRESRDLVSLVLGSVVSLVPVTS